MSKMKEFFDTIFWTNVLALLFLGGELYFFLVYVIETVVNFACWSYALYCYVWDHTHGNYDRL